MTIDATERAELEQLRLAIRLSGLYTWSYELGSGTLACAMATFTGVKQSLGYDPAELPLELGATLELLVVPADRARVLDELQAHLDGDTDRYQAEYRIRHKDGSVHWTLARGIVVRDDAARPIRLIGSSVDVARHELDDKVGGAPHEIQKVKAAEEAARRAEDDARRAVQQLRLATDLSGVGVWGYELSPDGDLAKARSAFDSDGVMLSLGYDPGDVEPTLTGRLGAVVAPEDQPRMQVSLQEVFTGTTPMFDVECRFVAKDGSLQWKLVRGLVTRDEAGRPVTFVGTAVEITQLKQIQEELQRVKERLELAVSGSNACTWDFEIVDGDLANARVAFNNYWELLGYDGPPPGIGRLSAVIEHVVAPEDRASLATDLQTFLGCDDHEWEREGRVVHRDGTERWQLSRGVVMRDGKGIVTRFTGASIDITDRKLTEKALQDSEERFRRTFENAAVGMILTDLQGGFLEYNARFCEFLGYSREELTGRRFVEFMVPGEIEGDLEQQRRVARGEIASFTRDKRYIRKDGAIVWGNITVSIIQRHADGTPVHVMGILQDITERMGLEVEIAKAQERMQLAMRDSDVAVVEGVFSRRQHGRVALDVLQHVGGARSRSGQRAQ
jgi:PAS domain S-box-containing protein